LLEPNNDWGTNDWTPSAAGDHYIMVDKDTEQPAIPSVVTWISDAVNGHEEIWNMESPYRAVESETLWIYGRGLVDGTVTARFSGDGTTWLASQTIIPAGGALGWYNVTWNGSFSAAQLDKALLKLAFATAGGGSAMVYAVYMEMRDASFSSSSSSS
jgi:hypothetical protein